MCSTESNSIPLQLCGSTQIWGSICHNFSVRDGIFKLTITFTDDQKKSFVSKWNVCFKVWRRLRFGTRIWVIGRLQYCGQWLSFVSSVSASVECNCWKVVFGAGSCEQKRTAAHLRVQLWKIRVHYNTMRICNAIICHIRGSLLWYLWISASSLRISACLFFILVFMFCTRHLLILIFPVSILLLHSQNQINTIVVGRAEYRTYDRKWNHGPPAYAFSERFYPEDFLSRRKPRRVRQINTCI